MIFYTGLKCFRLKKNVLFVRIKTKYLITKAIIAVTSSLYTIYRKMIFNDRIKKGSFSRVFTLGMKDANDLKHSRTFLCWHNFSMEYENWKISCPVRITLVFRIIFNFFLGTYEGVCGFGCPTIPWNIPWPCASLRSYSYYYFKW